MSLQGSSGGKRISNANVRAIRVGGPIVEKVVNDAAEAEIPKVYVVEPSKLEGYRLGDKLKLTGDAAVEAMEIAGINIEAAQQKKAKLIKAQNKIEEAKKLVAANPFNRDYALELKAAEENLNSILIKGAESVVVPDTGLANYERFRQEEPVIVQRSNPIRPTGKTIMRGVNEAGEPIELVNGQWVRPDVENVFDDNINYEYNPAEQGDDGYAVAEDVGKYNQKPVTIIEQVVSTPVSGKTSVPIDRYTYFRDNYLIEPNRQTTVAWPVPERVMADNSAEVFLNSAFRNNGVPVIRENLAAVGPDGNPYYGIPEDELYQMMVGRSKPTIDSVLRSSIINKIQNDIDSLEAPTMSVGPSMGPTTAITEGLLNDPVEVITEDPRLAGELLRDPRVRLGLAGAGAAGLLGLVAHGINQRREARRREAERQLNYPMEY